MARHAIHLGGRRTTSVSLEDAFWQGLKEIARRRQMTLSDLAGEIAAQRRHGNLSSAIRLLVRDLSQPNSPALRTARVLRGERRDACL